MELTDLVGLISRWIHIASAVALLGGVIFARHVLISQAETELLTRYAKTFQLASAGLLLSGLYNFVMKMSKVPPGYHGVFGIKFLLAMHVFAVASLLGRPGVEAGKRQRQMTGIIISGIAILALGAWLRFLTR